MIALLWLCMVAAVADDGREGLFLPGATPLAQGHGHVGAFLGGYAIAFVGSGSFPGGQLALGLTDRVAVIGGAFVTSPFDADPISTDAYHMVSLRWSAVELENIRFAPLLSHYARWVRPLVGGVGLGFALEGGLEKVRLDLSLPDVVAVAARVRGGEEYGLGPALLPTLAEGGITFLAGDHHRFRLGLPPLFFTWGIRTKNVYVDLSAMPLFVYNVGAIQVGARW